MADDSLSALACIYIFIPRTIFLDRYGLDMEQQAGSK